MSVRVEGLGEADIYLRSSHAIQASCLNNSGNSWENVEIEQRKDREPALRRDFIEGVLVAGRFEDDESTAITASTTAATDATTNAFVGPVFMTIGHQNCPVVDDV